MKHRFLAFAALVFSSQAIAQHFDWAARIGNDKLDRALSVMTDNQGNTYFGGHFRDTVDFDPGAGVYQVASKAGGDYGGDAFVLKLDQSDKFSKVLTFGYPTRNIAACKMEKAADGSLYISGYFNGTADFDPDTSEHAVTAISDRDYYVLKLDADEQFVWVKHWATNFRFEWWDNMRLEGIPMAIDGAGNICLAGHFKGKADFDPGLDTAYLYGKAEDGFILKTDPDGQLIWAKQLATDSTLYRVQPKSISTDGAGNIYVAGIFNGSVDFDPASGVQQQLSSIVPMGFLLKLDASGNFVWVKQIGGIEDTVSSHNQANAVATDAAGNVYVAGGFMGTASFGNTSLVSEGMMDVFVAKLDGNGSYQWAKRVGSTWDGDIARHMKADAAGNLFITGTFRSMVDFDPGPGVAPLIPYGNVDVFVWKLDTHGNYGWARRFGGMSNKETVHGIAVKNNAVYTAGVFTGQINCDPDGSYYMQTTPNASGVDFSDGYIHKLSIHPTSLHPLDAPLQVAIFPNPARDRITIALDNKGRQTIATLLDIRGKKLREATSDKPTFHMDTHDLVPGVYLVQILCGAQSGTFKMVKE